MKGPERQRDRERRGEKEGEIETEKDGFHLLAQAPKALEGSQSQELNPDLSCAWQIPNHQIYHLLPSRVDTGGKLASEAWAGY